MPAVSQSLAIRANSFGLVRIAILWLLSFGRDNALDPLPLFIRVGPGQIEEHRGRVPQGAARPFHCFDGIRERRLGGGFRDCRDPGLMLPHRLLERRQEVLVPDGLEGRQLEGCLPVLQQDVLSLHAASF